MSEGHDTRQEPARGDAFPETLFCITWDDGEAYVRTTEEFVDEAGIRRVVIEHDPDGSLTRRADYAFSGRPRD